MLFTTPIFFLFFFVYLFPHTFSSYKLRLFLVILGSSFFYGYWNPKYLWLPYLLIFISYYGALWIEKESSVKERRFRMLFIITILLLPLIFYKYTNFIFTLLKPIHRIETTSLINIVLPLGISFITFTVVAYVIDVYRRTNSAEKNLGNLMACVLYFPHLIAGPIVRPSQLIPQFQRWHLATNGRIWFGISLFTIGLFKKLFFADPIAQHVNLIYQNLEPHSMLDYWLAVYGFSIQIYCDFSGYTDMALGLSHILGIRLPSNFSRPYLATSPIDFWHRWHMTLSKWLRDYLYISLGGNQVGKWQQVFNLMTTMVLGGLWHGASLTFMVWGFLHGLALTIAHKLKGKFNRIPQIFSIFFTFHFVSFCWIYFRAPNFATATKVVRGLWMSPLGNVSLFFSSHLFEVILIVLFLGLVRFDSHVYIRFVTSRLSKKILCVFLLFLLITSVILSSGNSADFIYFDF